MRLKSYKGRSPANIAGDRRSEACNEPQRKVAVAKAPRGIEENPKIILGDAINFVLRRVGDAGFRVQRVLQEFAAGIRNPARVRGKYRDSLHDR